MWTYYYETDLISKGDLLLIGAVALFLFFLHLPSLPKNFWSRRCKDLFPHFFIRSRNLLLGTNSFPKFICRKKSFYPNLPHPTLFYPPKPAFRRYQRSLLGNMGPGPGLVTQFFSRKILARISEEKIPVRRKTYSSPKFWVVEILYLRVNSNSKVWATEAGP